MIIAQGWKNNKVYALVMSHGDMDVWQIYRGCYEPSAGGTYETAEWECLSTGRNLVELLYYHVIPEMTTWIDSGKEVRQLQDTLIAIHEQCKQITTYVKAACATSSPS